MGLDQRKRNRGNQPAAASSLDRYRIRLAIFIHQMSSSRLRSTSGSPTKRRRPEPYQGPFSITGAPLSGKIGHITSSSFAQASRRRNLAVPAAACRSLSRGVLNRPLPKVGAPPSSLASVRRPSRSSSPTKGPVRREPSPEKGNTRSLSSLARERRALSVSPGRCHEHRASRSSSPFDEALSGAKRVLSGWRTQVILPGPARNRIVSLHLLAM